MILDTSFLIDLFDGQASAFEKGVGLSESNRIQRVPSPDVMELSYAVAFGSGDEQRSVNTGGYKFVKIFDPTGGRNSSFSYSHQYKNALRMYPIVQQDKQIARRAGELLANADMNAGGDSGIDKVDPMVAAVAHLYDEPVLTDNVDDFEALNVGTETY